MERARQWNVTPAEPLTLQVLGRWMIDLEHLYVTREGRLSQCEAVEAGAHDDVLAHSSANRLLQCILGVSRAQDCPSITRMFLQRRVQNRTRLA